MNQLEQAKTILNSGGIVIFPTETVFGIGCLLKFPESIKKLYKIKKREAAKPTLVLVKDLATAENLVIFNEPAKRLAEQFWPGPLTICLPARKTVLETILGPGKTLAVRIPSEKWLLELLNVIDGPILGPSANFQGKKPPTMPNLIDKELIKLVDYVVNVEPGGKRPSTIVSFTDEMSYKVVRDGPIGKSEIEKALTTN